MDVGNILENTRRHGPIILNRRAQSRTDQYTDVFTATVLAVPGIAFVCRVISFPDVADPLINVLTATVRLGEGCPE